MEPEAFVSVYLPMNTKQTHMHILYIKKKKKGKGFKSAYPNAHLKIISVINSWRFYSTLAVTFSSIRIPESYV